MSQKSILITGCSSGIGYDAALGLTARGWRVFATCRQDRDVARLTGEGLESLKLDLTDPDSMTRALEDILARTGGTLDALFNNGAFGLPGACEDLPTDALREIFETNVFGTHELTRRVIPIMRAQGHGRIVQNSSVLGFTTYPWRSAYTATKYALEALTDTLRIEMRDTPIHVVLIEPGPIPTRIRENSIPHFERWIDWKSSPRRAQYEDSLLKRLYSDRTGPDPFELPPAAVTAKLVTALEHPRPKARYFVTKATWFAAIGKRLLPTRLMDAIIARS
ncbi:SDR family NAD(P)-dependent oxidoreductase [Aliiroseovarius subalbicans]|uniref:SDR family NAD(P)-dependent oxidoreductase n=1 Tax=Aliiroseovarius subalbicans TaxID=2925840 RepID=UPI001F595832|nr:SDR family NAD(P)-dependent oxidoreductase [Aliiroseovarius subalbicans]MCI2399698.1 SDR family NAD(P)-dependent oxidoreductase [Aliiroseovarius subalbicans]